MPAPLFPTSSPVNDYLIVKESMGPLASIIWSQAHNCEVIVASRTSLKTSDSLNNVQQYMTNDYAKHVFSFKPVN